MLARVQVGTGIVVPTTHVDLPATHSTTNQDERLDILPLTSLVSGTDGIALLLHESGC